MPATQQSTRQVQTPQPITAEQVSKTELVELLDNQTTIDPEARGDTYIPIQETNLPEISLEALEEGVLLYDPREPGEVLEVLEQYQDDFGKEKVRVTVHTSDHRHERTHSFFASHVLRDLSYIRSENVDPVEDVELSVDALASAWDGDTASDTTDQDVQTTLGQNETDDEESPVLLGDDSDESDDSDMTQKTLF